jgi:GxxExxY protein
MASRGSKTAGELAAPTGMALALLNYARHAMRVLGTGHNERIYHKALATSLGRSSIAFRSELVTPIMYMGECVGIGRADLVIQGCQRQQTPDLVVEIKANAKCPTQASGQLRKYMESLRSVERRECTGVVLNFNQASGQVEMHVEPVTPARPKAVPVKQSRFFAGDSGAGKRCRGERDGEEDLASKLRRLRDARAAVLALERELEASAVREAGRKRARPA